MQETDGVHLQLWGSPLKSCEDDTDQELERCIAMHKSCDIAAHQLWAFSESRPVEREGAVDGLPSPGVQYPGV